MTTRSLRERFERRRDVVAAVLAGSAPKAVAKEFGVSLASVYNWINEAKADGTKALVHDQGDKRFALGRLTPWSTLNLVKSAVQRRPGWSADKLSAFLGTMGRDIPPRTLRNMFRRLGLGTATERQAAAKAWRKDGRIVEPEIPDHELVDVLSQLEALPDGEDRGRAPGEVLVQDRIKFPVGFCEASLAIELIIDTFAPSRRIFALIGPPSNQLAVDALNATIALYRTEGVVIKKVCTPRKAQYARELGAFEYPEELAVAPRIEQLVRPVNSKSFDSRVRDAWNLMKETWLTPKWKQCREAKLTAAELADDLEQWLQHRRITGRR